MDEPDSQARRMPLVARVMLLVFTMAFVAYCVFMMLIVLQLVDGAFWALSYEESR